MQTGELLQALEPLAPIALGALPTPLQPLPRLSEALGGPELWVKRDDLTGLGLGGNKVRKLGYLMADAVRQGADVIITTGARQSNHARQTAAAAAHLGLPCVLVLGGTPIAPQGNHLLDVLLGAELRWAGDRPLPQALDAETEALRHAGRRPYKAPYGGSSALGACGYVQAFAELHAQTTAQALTFDAVVFASSSGGTQAGMVVGAAALGYSGDILGVSIAERSAPFRQQIAALANETAARLNLVLDISADSVQVTDAYLGSGYGIVGDREREAIALAARTEGLLTDPVYTGRALAGLIDLIRQGRFHAGQRVLFWHTGGAPALFAYAAELVP